MASTKWPCNRTVQTKIEDKTVFLVEAKQAGIFEIRGIPEEQLNNVIGISCPQILYPYLRGNVADIINRAGFPPVHMAEINFQALYEQQQAAAQAQKQASCSKHAAALPPSPLNGAFSFMHKTSCLHNADKR